MRDTDVTDVFDDSKFRDSFLYFIGSKHHIPYIPPDKPPVGSNPKPIVKLHVTDSLRVLDDDDGRGICVEEGNILILLPDAVAKSERVLGGVKQTGDWDVFKALKALEMGSVTKTRSETRYRRAVFDGEGMWLFVRYNANLLGECGRTVAAVITKQF